MSQSRRHLQLVAALNEVEHLRNAMYKVAMTAESLSDPSVLEAAERIDQVVVEILKRQESSRDR
jgi:PHP family Zn ribbon phosphoesterase